MEHHGWNVIDAEAGVLWREYRFSGKALATTLVFRGTDGSLVVVSPGTGLSAADYDALREFGEVRALVANNTFHHLGQQPWRQHFKDAQSYAPPRAVAALDKKVQGVQFRSLTELPLPAHVRWEDPPGFKTGEVLLSVDTKRGPVWYTGDLLANIQKMPGALFPFLFKLADSAPGFKLFKPCVWFFVNDKQAIRQWMLSQLDQHPPGIVVPAHGPIIDASDVAEQARAQIRKL